MRDLPTPAPSDDEGDNTAFIGPHVQEKNKVIKEESPSLSDLFHCETEISLLDSSADPTFDAKLERVANFFRIPRHMEHVCFLLISYYCTPWLGHGIWILGVFEFISAIFHYNSNANYPCNSQELY